MFKVGDEVLVKGEIVGTQNGSKYKFDVRLGGITHLFCAEEEMIPSDKTYEQGLDDAWELMKRICDMPTRIKEDLFGGVGYIYQITHKYTYEEALAKIEAYEREKEIKVGDEVKCGDTVGVVTCLMDDSVSVMWKDGSTGDDWNPKDLTKTGKHIDIEGLLRQIGE